MTVLGLHHAGKTVRDMEASLAFYRDLLGFTVIDDDILEGPEASKLVGLPNARLRAVMLSIDGETPFAELIQYHSPPSRQLRGDEVASDVGNAHFCFLVDDIHAERERLAAAGVRFTDAPLLAEEGRFEGEWAAYCHDPDGLMVELWSQPNSNRDAVPRPS